MESCNLRNTTVAAISHNALCKGMTAVCVMCHMRVVWLGRIFCLLNSSLLLVILYMAFSLSPFYLFFLTEYPNVSFIISGAVSVLASVYSSLVCKIKCSYMRIFV